MHKHESRFALGDMVREKISGLTGRVVGISFWETGCNHIGVKRLGLNKEEKPFDVVWFDEPNVDLCAENAASPNLAPNPSTKPGGPLPGSISYGR